ncbi:MAG: UDP-N-acetylmuramoyl-L-alanyl-D-glutamate--2,6-diaminopimelate ligase [Parcubacteria group bacterium]|nr:UDP-N-acetylmuramoyl-L-alanyl-D-glutamate--2,6-diaminopimelate ligase [Parcubacteria group bacterium]
MFREIFLLEKFLSAGRKMIPRPVFDFFQPWYHGLLALSGAVIFNWPSRRLKVIGVTGSKGKSTTVFLITRFLEEAGYKTAAIGSLGYKIGDREWPNNLKMTMPGRWKIQKFLAQAVKAGCRFAVLEVTSEGIKQKRHWGLKFDAAVFTNLEKEHIESHGSFEKYYLAKQELFKRTKKIHILNADSPYIGLFSEFKAEKKIFYSLKNYDFETSLKGDFNKYNILAAAVAAGNYGASPEIIQEALNKIKTISGRMEFIDAGQNFKVVVDYAHTPESLKQVYQTLKSEILNPKSETNSKFKIQNSKPKLICVLGAAGGGRDRWKRPIFGRLAQNYCDRIILTDEDPYDEKPEKIIEEIASGFSQTLNPKSETLNYFKILDRKEAIKKAITLAGENDIIAITGKGSENSMAVSGGRKIPWSDKGIVLDLLNDYPGKKI